jgi:uncharacterized membrane protein YfcA
MIDIAVALLSAVFAGFIGSLVGLGGAVILTPVLTFLGLDIRIAIAASMVAIIATSSGSASSYVKDGLSNIRAAFYLEMFTAVGAMVGAVITSRISPVYLYFFFAAFLGTSFYGIFGRRNRELPEVKQDGLARWLNLEGSYYDKPAKKEIHYKLTRPAAAGPGMFVAGVAAGMLGIGAGGFKVSIHELVMGMPSKVSTATSNFIIGMTALAGASVYFSSGLLYLNLAATLGIGTTVGATLGARVLPRLRNQSVKSLFLLVLVVLIVEMLYKGVTLL